MGSDFLIKVIRGNHYHSPKCALVMMLQIVRVKSHKPKKTLSIFFK
ncbi:MAG: hypothetical protein RIS79_3811 [Verrucomicrobiota bacterium]